MSNGQFHAPRRNRSKPAPPERTLSDFRGPADQITLSKIAIFGGGRLFAIQNTSHLEQNRVGGLSGLTRAARSRRRRRSALLPVRGPPPGPARSDSGHGRRSTAASSRRPAVGRRLNAGLPAASRGALEVAEPVTVKLPVERTHGAGGLRDMVEWRRSGHVVGRPLPRHFQ